MTIFLFTRLQCHFTQKPPMKTERHNEIAGAPRGSGGGMIGYGAAGQPVARAVPFTGVEGARVDLAGIELAVAKVVRAELL